MRLDRNFFCRHADVVAKDLLGKIIVRKGKRARIVETEAYFDETDPASRAVQNGDLRETMKMKPGTILVYGVHNQWLMNLVTGKAGKPEAVLLRALEPLDFTANARGPGLLTKAIDVNKNFHKKDIFTIRDLWIEENNEKFKTGKSFRIGVKKDLLKEMRFYIKGNQNVSGKSR